MVLIKGWTLLQSVVWNMQDKSTIDLLDMFAGYALSGYAREGLFSEDEYTEVSKVCYDLAFAMVMTRQEILEERDIQKLQES